MFPFFAAIVAIYGLFGDTAALGAHLDQLASFLPGNRENSADAMLQVLEQLHLFTRNGMAVLLLHHPAVMARLRDELADDGEEYLDAVVKESLRVRPVVPGIGRMLSSKM